LLRKDFTTYALQSWGSQAATQKGKTNASNFHSAIVEKNNTTDTHSPIADCFYSILSVLIALQSDGLKSPSINSKGFATTKRIILARLTNRLDSSSN